MHRVRHWIGTQMFIKPRNWEEICTHLLGMGGQLVNGRWDAKIPDLRRPS